MDVGAWLRGLGLGQYEATFRESEIDAEVLPDLTEGDLNQLGVRWGTASVSSRRLPLSGPGKPPPSRRALCPHRRLRGSRSAAQSRSCSAILSTRRVSRQS
jgi:hypothetical protein